MCYTTYTTHGIRVGVKTVTARPEVFAMRVTPEERQLIVRFAEHEERTPSDAARRILLAKIRELGIMPTAPKDNQHEALPIK